jgi:hypothetical protein
MKYTKTCDKITRVITSCVTADQLSMGHSYCYLLIKYCSLDELFNFWDLIDKLIHTQNHVISRTSKIL